MLTLTLRRILRTPVTTFERLPALKKFAVTQQKGIASGGQFRCPLQGPHGTPLCLFPALQLTKLVHMALNQAVVRGGALYLEEGHGSHLT